MAPFRNCSSTAPTAVSDASAVKEIDVPETGKCSVTKPAKAALLLSKACVVSSDHESIA